ncbi:MAG TPA: DMT family transporter [Galbitalea sp.]|jgi:transporter family-2 protein
MTSQHPSQPAAPSRARIVILLLVALLCGAGVALQSRINGQLGGELGDGSLAAVISFGSGLIVTIVALLVSRSGRDGLGTVVREVRARRFPWLFLLGGLGGGFFVLSQGITVGVIGVALFTVAAVAGQTISGLVIDARGIGTVAPKRVTVWRLVGSVIALAAVIISVGPEVQRNSPLWMLLMPFVVGLLLGWQQAFNGQVKTLAKSAITATFINFVGGTLLLIVAAAINLGVVGWPKTFPTNPLLYVGGVIGVIFIAGFAVVIPVIGVLLQSLAAVAGQLIMSLILAIVAPTSAATLTATTIVGTVLTLAGVAIASVPSRRRATALVE